MQLQPNADCFMWQAYYNPYNLASNVVIYFYPYNMSTVVSFSGHVEMNLTRYNKQQFISGTWLKDNQDSSKYVNESYQIQINGSNMVSTDTVTSKSGNTTITTGYVLQNTYAQNQYYDSNLGALGYNPNENVLFTSQAFYSQNGSLFSDRYIIGNWSNAYVFGHYQCCIPTLIEITNNTQTDNSDSSDNGGLLINYYFPQDQTNLSYCPQLSGKIQAGKGVLSSVLQNNNATTTPENMLRANWSDPLGFVIESDTDWSDYEYFNIDNSIPLIKVTYGDCVFVMEGSPRHKASSYWSSAQVVVLILGCFMIWV